MDLKDAVLNLLSVIIGGGIVGLPFALYHCGMIAGVFLQLFISWLTIGTMKCIFAAKDLTPGRPESYYEFGYMLLGRKSIYVIGLLIFITCFGVIMIYFIVFADITRSLVS